MFNDLSRLGKYLGQAARLMVGMPDYDNYVEHMRAHHPGAPVTRVISPISEASTIWLECPSSPSS